MADGTVEARAARTPATRGRGRPAKVFALTDIGRDHFDQQYDDLALEALRFLSETAGEDAVRAFADRRMSFIEKGFAAAVVDHPELTPAEALATVFTDAGYAASVRTLPVVGERAGEQLCQQHCPVSHVAHEFPSCARPRPRRSAGSSAGTSSGWPPSPTATASAPPASHRPPPERRSLSDLDRRPQPRDQGHRPLPVRLVRQRRRRRGCPARAQRRHRPRHLEQEVRAAVDARPASEGSQALPPQAHAHVGRGARRHRLREHQVLRPLEREAGRLVGGPARGHQEHLRPARHPRGREAASGRRRRGAVRVRGRLPLDPRGPRGAGRHLRRHRHRARSSTKT